MTEKTRWSTSIFKLTYAADICDNVLLAHLRSIKFGVGVKWYSIYHDENEDDSSVTTTILFSFTTRIDRRGANSYDAFNIELCDKRVIKVATVEQVSDVKRSADMFRSHQSKPGVTQSPSCPDDDSISLVSDDDASSRPAKKAKCEGSPTILFENPYSKDSYKLRLWGTEKNVFLSGPSGIGKTSWAAAQFACPCIVRDVSQLRLFREGVHDGLVFDEVDFSKWELIKVGHLMDVSQPYVGKNVSIPAKIRRIFVSRPPFEDMFPVDVYGIASNMYTTRGLVKYEYEHRLFDDVDKAVEHEEDAVDHHDV